MKSVQDYMRMADECRKLLKHTTAPEDRKRIKKICEMWEELADRRHEAIEQQAGRDRRKPKR